MDPDREPLSPNRAAQSDARGAHNIGIRDPAYNKQGVQPAKPGVQTAGPGIQPGPQQAGAHTGPREFYAADSSPDRLDYVSMISMVVLVGVMIALLATVHYVGILFLLALAPALFLISCCYGVGGTRQSVRINNLVRAYWLGLLFAIPVAVVEGVVVTKWWNAAGQPDYINWGPSRGMSLRWSIGAGFFVAFLIYGLFENTLKYIATRAYYNRAIFYTPFGLPLIGMAVALGFATVENLVFILLYGFVGAIIRGVIAVPFQAVIGLIIGTMLARHKWLTNQPDGVATQGKPGFGVYLKTILLTFILMGLFELPFMVILMRHKLYTYWAFWLLGSLPVLLASYIIYLVLSRPLRRATMTTS